MTITPIEKEWLESNPRVICGFPGIGKSYASKIYQCHDSDSSKFSWNGEERNPSWPKNYIDHIKNLNGMALTSTHAEVRKRAGVGAFGRVGLAPKSF